MFARVMLWLGLCVLAQPSAAQVLAPSAVRDFVADKYFEFVCFEGTKGGGWIFSDGSVAGTIQIRGTSEPRHVVLPTGTIQVKGRHYCATHPRLPFEPCFEVLRTGSQSFRGSLLGFAEAFCEFTKHKDPPVTAARSARLRSSQPMQLAPSSRRARAAF